MKNKKNEVVLNKIISFLDTYKASVNIKDDFNNADKLNSFIPTSRNLKLLNNYINIITKQDSKAVLLSGAYGTGKSYIGAVLLALLGGDLSQNDLKTLLKKIKTISATDEHRFSQIIQERKPLTTKNTKGTKNYAINNYLIVFPKDIFKDFKQAVSVGIKDIAKEKNIAFSAKSLHRAVYDKIQVWQNEHKSFFDAFVNELEKLYIPYDNFMEQVKDFNSASYATFEDIYPKIMAGEKFSPEHSIASITDLMREFELSAKCAGYKGVIYLFDEFGRYLEQNINSVDVKQVQDAAEYCNSGTNSTLLLITHKDLFQYSRKVDNGESRQEWEKVSGRFKKEHLVYEETSINEMLKVILHKNGAYNDIKKNSNKVFESKVNELELWSKFSEKNAESAIDAVYPLNYISAKILPILSQKLAQNERTMFSFLCGDESKSLKNIFDNTGDKLQFISANSLYDYFEDNFQYLNEDDYNIYLNAKSAISKLNSSYEKKEIKIIKTIALLHILNKFSLLPPTIETIKIASGIDKGFEKSIKSLKDKSCISNRGNDDKEYYRIVKELDVSVEKEVEKYIHYSAFKFNYIETLTKHLDLGYEYPVKYNDEYKITRYFKKSFLDVANIADIDKKILANKNEDGKIIYLLNLENKNYDFDSLLLEYGRSIIFIKTKGNTLDLIKNLKELETVEILLTRPEIIVNKTVKYEFLRYKEETIEILDKKLKLLFDDLSNTKIYLNGSSKASSKCKNNSQFQEKLQSYLKNKYTKYIKINYELINKNKLTPPIKKARREIITRISNNKIDKEYLEKTGAANSIARVLLYKTETLDKNFKIDFTNPNCIYKKIYKDFINFIDKDMKSLNDVYAHYTSNSSTWGLRKGIFSFLLAVFANKHREDIYISLNNDEVVITPELFDKFDINTDGYKINYIEYTEDKKKCIKEIKNKIHTSVDNQLFEKNNTLAVLNGLKLYIYAQPKLVLQNISDHKTLQKMLENISMNNSKDFFFKKLLRIYGKKKNFIDISKLFLDDLECIETETENLQNEIEQIIKTELSLADKNLKTALFIWANEQNIKNCSNNAMKLINFCQNLQDYEGKVLNVITELICGFDYYNWRDKESIKHFKNDLKKLNKELINSNKNKKIFDLEINDDIVLSPMANMLKRKLEADIKNMGKAVSDEEIKNILKQLIIN